MNRPDQDKREKAEGESAPKGEEWLALGAEALRYGGALGLRPDAVFSMVSRGGADSSEQERSERESRE